MRSRVVEQGALALTHVSALLRAFTPWNWAVAAIATGVAILAIGVPTRIIANDWFARMTPVRLQDYVFWAISAPLIGLIVASFTLRGGRPSEDGKLLSGGLLSYLAVGCPVCNKIIVLAIGTSGALTFYGPLQLYLGAASVLLLAWALVLRARAVSAGCPLPVRANSDASLPAGG